MRRNFGLDRPVPIQYVKYLTNAARGNFGVSYRERRPVIDVVRDRVLNTLLLAVAALVIDFGLGILIGTWQALRRGSWADTAASLTTVALYSTPVFWLGLMFMLVFAVQLSWLPVAGVTTVGVYDSLSPLAKIWDRFTHLVLPAMTLGLIGAGATARYQRSAMIETLSMDFVRTARAKGLAERDVIRRHALRYSFTSVITLFGLAFPVLLSGSVLVEYVFAWPGLGKLAADSIFARDYPVVTALATVTAVMVVVGTMVADFVNAFIDPRLRDRL